MPQKRHPSPSLDRDSSKRHQPYPSSSSPSEGGETEVTDCESDSNATSDVLDESELCANCKKLDLDEMFKQETAVKDIGPVGNYNHPRCPFCSIIQRSIRMHWDPKTPRWGSYSAPPQLFIQSREWCTFWNKGRKYSSNRIILGTDKLPVGLKLKSSATSSSHFILTEWELVTDDTPTPSIRRKIGPRLDIALPLRWLKGCQTHSVCKSLHVGAGSELFRGGFRLIDVFEWRLIETTAPCQYFALSYVWGDFDPFALRTTTRNITTLRRPFSLKECGTVLGKRLPRTILDAMELCRVLGQRYLWADCLSIVQDDPDERRRLVHGMGGIYENASLTIIAAYGTDADAGLAGITPREDRPYEKVHTIKTQSGLLRITLGRLSREERVRGSYWNTRGWTCQEQALTQRRLYLTLDEAFFICPFYSRREGYAIEDFENFGARQGYPIGTLVLEHTHGMSQETLVSVPRLGSLELLNDYGGCHNFASAISDYTRRNLTYADDVLNAFTGIYRRFTSNDPSDPGIVATQGTPVSLLPRALLWVIYKSDSKNLKRRDEIHTSWSWTSCAAPAAIWFIAKGNESINAERGLHMQWHRPRAYYSYRHYRTSPLVTECFLTFQIDMATTRVGFPVNASYPDVFEYNEFGPNDFLSLLQRRPEPRVHRTLAGMVDFVAPCIPFSCGFALTEEAEWEGYRPLFFSGMHLECGQVNFDSDDEDIDDFVLLVWDGSFMGLGVKSVDGVSRRVAVVLLKGRRDIWEEMLGTGLLDVKWKHIYLQ